jgi:hypothetical protein
LILLIGILLAIGGYISFYFIFKGHNHATTDYFSEITYQNLIIGTIAKQYALITTLELMKAGVSKRVPNSYYAISLSNINYLQNIKLLGSSPYPLTTYISATSPREFYSDEFLLSYINYAVNMISGMQGKTTQAELVSVYNSIEKFKIDYLKLNGDITRNDMNDKVVQRQAQILQLIADNMKTEVIMLVAGVASLVFLSFILACVISKIN